jgi:hypothetical protein
MTDERLAEAYQHAVASRATGDRTGCAAPEALLALARREGPEEERLATLDHAMACAGCKRELDLLVAVEAAAGELGVARGDAAPAPVPLRPRPTRAGSRRIVALALAASALVAVGVVVREARGPGEPGDVLRGEARGIVATEPAPGETVGLPVTFAWRPVPGATRYTVEVLAADGRVAWSAETREPTATLSDPGALAPGAEYRWWVRVTGGAGEPNASEARPLRIGQR